METELLHKYLAGEYTAEEAIEIENWLESSPENQQIMKEIKQVWSIPPGRRVQVNSEEAWESFRNRVIVADKAFPNAMHQRKSAGRQYSYEMKKMQRRGRAGRLVAYGAVIAAVLLITFQFSIYISQSTSAVTSEYELSMQEITTEKGQRTTVRLSDGTRVHLNAESRLIVPESYTSGQRIVTLEGEAYFEVAYRSDSQFLVQARNSITKVLGTKFNVRAYPDEENVEVVVAEGKVSMSSDEHVYAPEVQLTQNQRGTLSRSGEVAANTVSDVEVYMGWTKGQLTFQDATVQQIKTRLERWFDIEVILKDDFTSQEKLLTGTFEGAPLSIVLSSISLSLDLHYKQDGNSVFFSKDQKVAP